MTGRRTMSAGRRAIHSRMPAALEDDMVAVASVLDKLADEITDDCMRALAAVLERVGLPADLGGTRGLRLRAAVRRSVIETLYGALRERVGQIEDQPEMVTRLRVSPTRETIIELLAEYGR
jgi:hypothetical protein